MSNLVKFNSAWLSVVVSSVGTAGYITWLASAKASAIETAQREIVELKDSDKQQSVVLSRLDERTAMILEALRGMVKK